MIVDVVVKEEDRSTTLIIENIQSCKRWAAVFASKEDACWYLEASGILPPSQVDALRAADLSEMRKAVGYIRDPKGALREFASSTMTPWH